MKGEMVYLVVREWAFDGESGFDIDAFASFDDAFKCFKRKVKFETENSWVKEGGDIVIKMEDCAWEAYERGYYSELHTSISVEYKCIQ